MVAELVAQLVAELVEGDHTEGAAFAGGHPLLPRRRRHLGRRRDRRGGRPIYSRTVYVRGGVTAP